MYIYIYIHIVRIHVTLKPRAASDTFDYNLLRSLISRRRYFFREIYLRYERSINDNHRLSLVEPSET